MATSFGGDWTKQKLDCVEKYLDSYLKIMKSNPRASRFEIWYVDGFAGSGTWTKEELYLPLLGNESRDSNVAAFLDGSVRRALNLSKTFDHYLFIEKLKRNFDDLSSMIFSEYPHLSSRIVLRHKDANEVMPNFCAWLRQDTDP